MAAGSTAGTAVTKSVSDVESSPVPWESSSFSACLRLSLASKDSVLVINRIAVFYKTFQLVPVGVVRPMGEL